MYFFPCILNNTPAGKKRRLTIIECGNDMNTMIDVAKVADLVSGQGHIVGTCSFIRNRYKPILRFVCDLQIRCGFVEWCGFVNRNSNRFFFFL